jgi:O-antigen/teichoic acid export membrane protein
MIARIRRTWTPGEFTRNVAILAGGIAVGQAVVVLASPLVTRLYEPADFGVYAAAASLISILAVLTPLGYHRAIPLPESRAQAASLVVLSLSISALTSGVSAVIFTVFGTHLMDQLNAPALAPFLWAVVVGQLGAAVYMIVSTWAIRVRHFAAIARTRLMQGVGLVGFQIAMSGFSGGFGLVIGDVIGRTAGTARLAGELWSHEWPELRRVRLSDTVEAAIRYRRFPIYTNVSSLLDTLILEMPVLLLLSLYGPRVGGLYLLVARVAGLPAALIGVAAGQVFFADAARMARDVTRLRALFVATGRRLFLLGLAPAALAAVVAPYAFPYIFGQEWAEAGVYFTLLTPMFLLQFATAPTGGTLAVLERQDLSLVREILRGSLMLVAIMLAASTETGPLLTVALISIAGCLGYAVYLLTSWYALAAAADA